MANINSTPITRSINPVRIAKVARHFSHFAYGKTRRRTQQRSCSTIQSALRSRQSPTPISGICCKICEHSADRESSKVVKHEDAPIWHNLQISKRLQYTNAALLYLLVNRLMWLHEVLVPVAKMDDLFGSRSEWLSRSRVENGRPKREFGEFGDICQRCSFWLGQCSFQLCYVDSYSYRQREYLYFAVFFRCENVCFFLFALFIFCLPQRYPLPRLGQ